MGFVIGLLIFFVIIFFIGITGGTILGIGGGILQAKSERACPYCQMMISKKAKTCGHCRASIPGMWD